MVQFGPSDYSMSIGVTPQTAGERVHEAEKYVLETAHRMGIPARVELGDASGAERYLEMGVRHFCVGWDVGILHRWFTEQGEAMRSMVSGSAVKAGTPSDTQIARNRCCVAESYSSHSTTSMCGRNVEVRLTLRNVHGNPAAGIWPWAWSELLTSRRTRADRRRYEDRVDRNERCARVQRRAESSWSDASWVCGASPGDCPTTQPGA